MLTLERYTKYESNMQEILDGGKNVQTGEPFSIETVDKNLDITFEEHFTFQNTQAWAHVSEIIAPDVAAIIYDALGESLNNNNGGWKSHVTTARKQAITQLMSELLKQKVAR